MNVDCFVNLGFNVLSKLRKCEFNNQIKHVVKTQQFSGFPLHLVCLGHYFYLFARQLLVIHQNVWIMVVVVHGNHGDCHHTAFFFLHDLGSRLHC